MINYTFDGKKSTFKNDLGEVTVQFKKVSEQRVTIDVKMKHDETNTVALYQKTIELRENGYIHHFPIKHFVVKDRHVGENNTTKKYFTSILGVDGYQQFREGFLKEYERRLEMELEWIFNG